MQKIPSGPVEVQYNSTPLIPSRMTISGFWGL